MSKFVKNIECKVVNSVIPFCHYYCGICTIPKRISINWSAFKIFDSEKFDSILIKNFLHLIFHKKIVEKDIIELIRKFLYLCLIKKEVNVFSLL